MQNPHDANAADPSTSPREYPHFISQTLLLSLVGSLLLWAAFPPLNLPLLAWLAPIPWLWLAQRPQLPGWRPYIVLWLAGTTHWLLMLDGIRLAHPALYAGWIALAAYLGVYLPIFVGLTRVAVHRLKVFLIIAAPVIWVGLELIRGHLITGFSMGLLAHTQAEFPHLIQVADFAGGYTLSFVIMLIAACLTRVFRLFVPTFDLRPLSFKRLWPVLPASATLAIALLYGHFRLNQTPPATNSPSAKVALIQGSLDTVFDVSSERIRETFDHYRNLTSQAVRENPNLDLVAWPESMFAVAETIAKDPITPPANSGLSADEFSRRLNAVQTEFQAILADEAARANVNTDVEGPSTKLLVGTTTFVYEPERTHVYNTALLADKSGQTIGRYYKTHPVMFGEYIPFAEWFPWLYKITPMAGGLSSGSGPTTFEVAGLKMSPSICFESTIPHLIRGQLAELSRKGSPADVLINVTNDGWFWGTGMLDLHFRCGVFRAVENRKPLLVVANTGISTFVDGNGVIRLRGPRRETQVLVAEVRADGRDSPYAVFGDWPAWFCATACFALAWLGLASVVGRRRNPKHSQYLPKARKRPKLP